MPNFLPLAKFSFDSKAISKIFYSQLGHDLGV